MCTRQFSSKITLLLLAVFAVLVFSCKKSNNAGSSGPGISATIGDSSFQSIVSTGLYYQSGGYFDLVGYAPIRGGSDSALLELSFVPPTALNHPFTSDTTLANVGYFDEKLTFSFGVGVQYLAGVVGHSVFNVTSWDSVKHQIAGTVSAELYDGGAQDSLPLVNGKFNVSYILHP